MSSSRFEVDLCTVARWGENGQIIEENLFYGLAGQMTQIGLKGTMPLAV